MRTLDAQWIEEHYDKSIEYGVLPDIIEHCRKLENYDREHDTHTYTVEDIEAWIIENYSIELTRSFLQQCPNETVYNEYWHTLAHYAISEATEDWYADKAHKEWEERNGK